MIWQYEIWSWFSDKFTAPRLSYHVNRKISCWIFVINEIKWKHNYWLWINRLCSSHTISAVPACNWNYRPIRTINVCVTIIMKLYTVNSTIAYGQRLQTLIIIDLNVMYECCAHIWLTFVLKASHLSTSGSCIVSVWGIVWKWTVCCTSGTHNIDR